MAKHLKMINLVAVLAATSCAANTPKEVNANPINDISAGDKINIVPTVFTNNMIDLGEMQYALTQGDIINALYINANDNFKDVVNELDIIGPTLENSVYTYTATARASSRTYNGSVTLTYTLTAKTDIATLVTDKTLYPDRATSG
jgi:hypothetical protein